MRAAVALPCLAALWVALGAGCSERSVEERAREQAEKIEREMGDPDAVALEQPADPAVVREVQAQLTAIKEYQGEVNGTIDSVTVNALQAFQRTAGLRADGLLTEATRRELAAAAARADGPAPQ